MAKDAALCRSWLEVQAVWLVAETKKKNALAGTSTTVMQHFPSMHRHMLTYVSKCEIKGAGSFSGGCGR